MMAMKKIALTLMVILILTFLCASVEAGNRDEVIKATPITIYVDDNFTDDPENHKWDTIQDGIDDANEGDTVYVFSGTYSESIVINKTISLIGEDRGATVIDGMEGIREVIRVEANWVNISSFTLKSKQKGIFLDSVSNDSITNCNISDNEYGILFEYSSNNTVTSCNISDNSNYGIQFDLSSNNNTIYHNNFIGNTNHAYDICSNYWDNGYPSGGNYWGGWIGIADNNYGENQDMPGSDGIYDGNLSIAGGSNKDRYPLSHSFFWWDKTLPEISVSPSNNSVIKPGTTIDFEIDDENLNIVRYSINEEGYEPFPSPYNLDTADWDDGVCNIIIYANDYGRNEISEYFIFTVDGIEPEISTISPEDNTVIKPGTIIDFEIDDAHLNLTTYTLNDGLPETLSSPYNITTEGWKDGTYNITIWADDLAGNEASETFVFTLDGTPPSINISGVANGSYYNTNVTIFVEISDAHLNTSKNNITLDNTSFVSGTTVSSEGEHMLFVYAIDAAGNIAEKTIIFTIDKTKPSINITGVANGSYYNTDVIPVIDVSDANMNIASIILNGNPFASGSTISAENEYILVVQATDKAGNNVSETIIFTIDKTPPTIKISEKNQTTKSSSFTIHWYSSEPVRYYEVSMDGEKWINISTKTSCTFTLSRGINTFYVRGTDAAGNVNKASVTIERIEEEEEVDYLTYLITIPIVLVVVLVAIMAFLKRKISIRCPACKAVFNVKPRKRPLKTECPKCGREGVLR